MSFLYQLQKSIQSLDASLAKSKKSIEDKHRQLVESKKLGESYHGQIQHLENALAIHAQETEATDNLVTKIKALHAEHCDGLEKQIMKSRQSCEEKLKVNTQLKKRMEQMSDQLNDLEQSNSELKHFIKKMEELDEEKKTIICNYEEKLKVYSLEFKKILSLS